MTAMPAADCTYAQYLTCACSVLVDVIASWRRYREMKLSRHRSESTDGKALSHQLAKSAIALVGGYTNDLSKVIKLADF
jgi:hypothetical protein